MNEELKIGDVFYTFSPDIDYVSFGFEKRVYGNIKYGEFEVIKINEKSVITKNRIQIGCSWGTKRKKSSLLDMPKTKERLLSLIKNRTDGIIKAYEIEKGKYTKKAPEFYVANLWIMTLKLSKKLGEGGLELEAIKEANVKIVQEAKKVEEKIIQLNQLEKEHKK